VLGVGIKSGVEDGTAPYISLDDEVGAEETDTGAFDTGSSTIGMEDDAAVANTEVLDVDVEELESAVTGVVRDITLMTPVVARLARLLRGSRSAAEIH
jgi:hypothetical protein